MTFRTLYLSLIACAVAMIFITQSNSEELGPEWVTEQQMKFLVGKAIEQQRVLTRLNCRFAHDDNPRREDVRFKPFFVKTDRPVAWGWTFDANAPLEGPEKQARAAGFEVFSEDYFEVTGVTWVRCKIWHRP